MRVYFDASFLVPIFIPESESERIEAHIQSLTDKTIITVSYRTIVEVASVFSRLVRMREVERSTALMLSQTASNAIQDSFDVFTPGKQDFELCLNYLNNFDNTLRAGDALHLAIAANRNSGIIYSLDKAMLKAGTSLGLMISDGN